MIFRHLLVIILTAVVLLIQGCGGSKHVSSLTHQGDGGQTDAFVNIVVEWPPSRLIPPETQSIRVLITGVGIDKPISVRFNRPSGSAPTLVKTVRVPAGPNRLFSAIAQDAKGQIVALGNNMSDLHPGETTNVTIVMDNKLLPASVPEHIENPEDVGLQFGIQAIVDPDDPLMGKVTFTGAIENKALVGLKPSDFIITQDAFGILVRTNPTNFRDLGPTTNPNLDIAFVLDTTGSMGEEIAGVRESVRSFSQQIAGMGFNLRLAAVTFGDVINDPDGSKDPDGNPRPVFNFSEDVEKFRSFVAGLDARGGGDDPEISLDAVLFAATSLSWRSDARKIIILITDAVAHQRNDGTEFSSVTAEEVIAELKGEFTVHVVSSERPNKMWQTNSSQQREKVYTHLRERQANPTYDVRNLAGPLGGVWLPLPLSGNVDLIKLGIAPLIRGSYEFKFPLMRLGSQFINVFVQTPKGWVQLQMEVKF